MEDAESDQGHSQNAANDSHDHNDHSLADVLGFIDDEHRHVDDGHDDAEGSADQKRNEITVVSFSNAGADYSAVMVKHFYTVLAGRAVAGPLGSKYMTSLA